jgi:hypothetical protein
MPIANPTVGATPFAGPGSGTYSFDPSVGELTLYAFDLAGVRSTALTQHHMRTARMAANMINARWSAMGVNLWAVDLQTIQLTPGNPTYSVPQNTIDILDAYATNAGGQDRIITPVSRTEYASYPNKQQQGAVTTYWFNKLLAPTITFYLSPDGTYPSVSYYRLRQIQDAVMGGGAQPEIPFYFIEAYAIALAWRLAVIWNPSLAASLKTLADEAYEIAANRNTEQAAFYVTPMITPYFRP